jgi:hypothetical protein
MCYTASTSMYAFIINAVSSLVLYYYATHYNTNDNGKQTLQISSLAFLYIGLMQLYDYIFWTNQRNAVNAFTTKLAMLTNHMQPLVLYALVNYYIGSVSMLGKVFTGLYTLAAVIYSAALWPKLKYTEVTIKSSPSLNWAWTVQPFSSLVYLLYVLAISVLSITMFSSPYNWLFTGSFIGLLFFSRLKYYVIQSTGRFWCYFFSFMPLMTLGVALFGQ